MTTTYVTRHAKPQKSLVSSPGCNDGGLRTVLKLSNRRMTGIVLTTSPGSRPAHSKKREVYWSIEVMEFLLVKEVYWSIEIVESSVKKRKKVSPEVVQYGSPDG